MRDKQFCNVCDKMMFYIRGKCRMKHDSTEILKARQTIVGLSIKEEELLLKVLKLVRDSR